MEIVEDLMCYTYPPTLKMTSIHGILQDCYIQCVVGT